MSRPDQDFQQRMQRVEGLLRESEQFADPRAQAVTRELVRCLMDLHGAGLARMMELLGEAGPAGQGVMHAFAADDLVASVLLLYELHPQDLATRVHQALEAIGPHLQSYKAEIALLALTNGVASLQLTGCKTHETGQLLVRAVEEALLAVAPDLESVHIEGIPEAIPDELGRFSLPLLGAEGHPRVRP